MTTRRARIGGSTARIALIGALVVMVAFGAVEFESIVKSSHASDPHHARIVAGDTRSVMVAASSTRTRGETWGASFVTAVICAALAAQLLRSRGRIQFAGNLQRFSVRLRAPPQLHVAL